MYGEGKQYTSYLPGFSSSDFSIISWEWSLGHVVCVQLTCFIAIKCYHCVCVCVCSCVREREIFPLFSLFFPWLDVNYLNTNMC